MTFSNFKTLIAATALSAGLMGTAHAQTITGDSSNWNKVDIGVSTVSAGTVHVPGRVGIGVPNTGLDENRIDFEGLKGVLGSNGDGVTTFTATTTDVDDHSTYGRFDFAQAGSEDVWFGEWSQTGSASAGDHTVYYGGTDATTAIPASGSATYSVKGIGDYQNNGILAGAFSAVFAGGSGGLLTGSLSNSGSSYTVNIGTAAISSGGAITGSGATASDASSTLATGGDVSGQFFGSNVDALAGIVAFSNNQYDTAFGGTKN